jgi:hypothetical protein
MCVEKENIRKSPFFDGEFCVVCLEELHFTCKEDLLLCEVWAEKHRHISQKESLP